MLRTIRSTFRFVCPHTGISTITEIEKVQIENVVTLNMPQQYVSSTDYFDNH
jgi:hypothetical protein